MELSHSTSIITNEQFQFVEALFSTSDKEKMDEENTPTVVREEFIFSYHVDYSNYLKIEIDA